MMTKDISREEVQKEYEEASKRFAKKWEFVGDQSLDSLSENIKKLKPKDAAVVAAIATDKMTLLRGGATQRIESSPLAILINMIGGTPPPALPGGRIIDVTPKVLADEIVKVEPT